AELGLADRVDVTGWVGAAETDALLAGAHLLLLPSREEGLPMSVLEAIARGIPVVTTPVGAIPDVVQDGVQGLVVEPGDSGALAAAIAELLADEPRRRR